MKKSIMIVIMLIISLGCTEIKSRLIMMESEDSTGTSLELDHFPDVDLEYLLADHVVLAEQPTVYLVSVPRLKWFFGREEELMRLDQFRRQSLVGPQVKASKDSSKWKTSSTEGNIAL